MKGIIMAGGQGTRLRPLTCDRPKPMVPVANRPIMEYAVDLLRKQGIKEIGVTLQYLPEKIQDYFQDGSSFGVGLHYFIEEIPLGTAGSVKNAEDFLNETFIVVSGDALTDFNLKEAIKYHREKGAIATLVLTAVKHPLEYGVVITEKDGKIKRFLEKPGWGEVFSDWVNTGIYVLEPEVLNYFKRGEKYDFSKDLFPKLLEKGEPVYGCLLEGYWCDVGNLEQYLQAHRDILAGKVDAEIRGELIDAESVKEYDGGLVYGPALLGENLRLEEGSRIESFSIVGDNVTLDKEATVKRGVIWNNVYLGKNSSVSGAVIGQGVTIKNGSVVLEGAAVGDESLFEERSMVKPDVKVWPGKTIEAGTVVKDSIVWGTKQRRHLFGREGITGLVNEEITPELAAKIGAAYGTNFKKSSGIAVSSDGRQASKMLKNALACGLISTGVKVSDLGEVTTPVQHYAICRLGLDGGIHVKSYADGQKVCLQFFDSEGINIDRSSERKIESMLSREEFRRVKGDEINNIQQYSDILQGYIDSILAKTETQTIRDMKARIVVDVEQSVMKNLLNKMADRLDLEIIYKEDGKGNSFFEKKQDIKGLAEKIAESGAELGAVLEGNGEKIFLMDNRGRIIDEDAMAALVALILFKDGDEKKIVLPVTASEAVEEIAEKYGGEVLRTKTSPRSVLQKALEIEVTSQKKLYSQFLFNFDALYTLVKILEFIRKKGISLAELHDEIPEIHRKVETAGCPWDEKGRVMRSLVENENEEKMELIDGVKIRHDNGWSLILPLTEQPAYSIYSEAKDFETAEELTRIYKDKITKILEV